MARRIPKPRVTRIKTTQQRPRGQTVITRQREPQQQQQTLISIRSNVQGILNGISNLSNLGTMSARIINQNIGSIEPALRPQFRNT